MEQMNQPKDTMREAADTVRDAADRFTSKMRSGEMMDNVQEVASDFYEQASSWMTENYGKALGIAGVLFAVGALGYYLGRNSGSDLDEDIEELMSEASRRMDKL